jgi:hypothetical protein
MPLNSRQLTFFMTRFFTYVSALCLTLLITGCNHYGSDAMRAAAKKRLASSKSDAGSCPKPVIAGSDLVSRLDKTLFDTKESKAWPVSATDHCLHKLPYHFTVVSTSPAIVIGSPVTFSANNQCSTNSASINCLRSKLFDGYYEVDNTFTHTPQMVWFSPEHGARLFDVPSQANSIFLLINGKSIRLKRKGNEWRFSEKN